MDIDNKILTVNEKKYLVMESVNYKDKKYVYLVNKVDASDSIFREIVMDSGLKLYNVDSELLLKELWPLFVDKFIN